MLETIDQNIEKLDKKFANRENGTLKKSLSSEEIRVDNERMDTLISQIITKFNDQSLQLSNAQEHGLSPGRLNPADDDENDTETEHLDTGIYLEHQLERLNIRN